MIVFCFLSTYAVATEISIDDICGDVRDNICDLLVELDGERTDRAETKELISQLVQEKNLVDVRNREGEKTASNRDTDRAEINELISQLVQEKNLVDVRNREGNTALNMLVRGDNVEAVQRLVSAGADVNIPNDGGDTPLISVACYNKTSQNVEIAKILVENGANINAQEDIKALTALHCAVSQGQFALAYFLLDQDGVDVFIQDDDGDTVLHLLSYRGIMLNMGEIMDQMQMSQEEEVVEEIKRMLEDEGYLEESQEVDFSEQMRI